MLEQENLGARAAMLGDYLRGALSERLCGYEMVAGIRGVGLLCGVEFRPPRQLRLRLPFEAFSRIHPAMFGQVLVMRLFRDGAILSQICGNNFMVLKAAPPLIVTEQQLDQFVHALARVVELMHSSAGYWSEALGMARRVLNVI